MKLRLFFVFLFASSQLLTLAQPSPHDMHFDNLAKQWDEAIPLGNGMIGALIWQKENNLRFSLDRADLWDMRPMKGLHRPEFSYQWVVGQVKKNDYKPVQQYFDAPYDHEPGPSKIPGGALEFETKNWGEVKSVHLFIQNAVCEVKWTNGVSLKTFVHATLPIGWFRFENIKSDITPLLKAPKYQGVLNNGGDPVKGDDLARLGYTQGVIKQSGNSITYRQQGWGGFNYEITVRWKRINQTTIEGTWSISSQYPNKKINITSAAVTGQALARSYENDYGSHQLWWKNYWSKSTIRIPDTLLEKQYYLDQYKFGAASRKGAPPISLQAVWTADNGHLPPWKGDYHHDLNTQLSYWPSYAANHMDDALVYLDHLDANKANYKRYTKLYFGKDGLAVPGVTTLDGTEMGGWIQYALSPTVSSWLAQHYYLQWRYSMDKNFLKQRAYPWIKDVAIFLESMTAKDENGHRQLPISSSPEINNNDITAWFPKTTNYDLALIKNTFTMATNCALALGLKKDAEHWQNILNDFGELSLTDHDELMFSPSMTYNQSHRHFSHMMAIHPLGLIKWEDGIKSQTIIKNSIRLLDSIGPAAWCGYSYAWLANMKARAKDGAGAVKDLDIFARAFCSINSFHLNGDQTKSGYSKFVYRPFTLEGNFAFAAGIQEMLLQSYAGFIEVFPAVPTTWQDISFNNLRAEGAFLVSAERKDGIASYVKIISVKGGSAKLKLPFKTMVVVFKKDISLQNTGDGYIELTCKPGGVILIKNGYE